MRHRKHTDKLGRKSEHRAATVTAVTAALLEHEKITTTLRIAKSIRRYAEKMITLAKKNTLHTRRQAIAFLKPTGQDRKDVVVKLFEVLGPKYADRQGGYTRIIKMNNRRGDNAPVAIIELVGNEKALKTKVRKENVEKVKVATEVAGELQSQNN